jgi:hypothetical protein
VSRGTPSPAAAAAPPVELTRRDPARQHRPVRPQPLTHHLQPELIETAERAKIRAQKGNVNHVEVFSMGGVGTFILRRPRPPSPQQRAKRYTLNPEEPVISRVLDFSPLLVSRSWHH